MSDREKRQKAQDVFNESTSVLSEKATFAKAFPEVEQCIIEVREIGHGVGGWVNEEVRRYTNPGEYINCSNAVCYNGGFNIDWTTIRDMVRAHKTEKEGNALCQGDERSPKGRIYGKCGSFFKYKVTITYRTSETDQREVPAAVEPSVNQFAF